EDHRAPPEARRSRHPRHGAGRHRAPPQAVRRGTAVTPPATQLVRDVVWTPLAHGAAPAPAAAPPTTPNDAVAALFGRLMRFIGATRELSTSPDRFPWAAL